MREEDRQKWAEIIKQRNSRGTWLEGYVLESDAFRELADFAVKVFLWFRLRARRAKAEKRPGGRERGGEFLDEDLRFSYNEAEFRGLTHGKFRRCLEELHAVGFIDIAHPGSARKGDETRYRLSGRWKLYKSNGDGKRGGPLFQEIPYPKSVHWVNFGFGRTQKKRGKNRVLRYQK